jgi:hypothetical protein
MPEVAAGGWRLRAKVPDGIFTLAVEADDETAHAEHAAFADCCLPLIPAASDDPRQVRLDIVSQLTELRHTVAGTGLGYLGAVADVRDGRPALLLLGIAAIPLSVPEGIESVSLLAAMLRHGFPGAQIEDFPTAQGQAVGLQRYEEQTLAGPALGSEAATITTGISQALVPFPEADLLGLTTGLCLTPDDIDLATVFTATIAYHLTIGRGH